ncbi:MAG: hypothetical protein BGO98_39145 [Myxococcales bacterium 68-20]|nr:MAG: hypothetical protein BGO98_39145 [Myxococcales bacterium 68-20]
MFAMRAPGSSLGLLASVGRPSGQSYQGPRRRRPRDRLEGREIVVGRGRRGGPTCGRGARGYRRGTRDGPVPLALEKDLEYSVAAS